MILQIIDFFIFYFVVLLQSLVFINELGLVLLQFLLVFLESEDLRGHELEVCVFIQKIRLIGHLVSVFQSNFGLNELMSHLCFVDDAVDVDHGLVDNFGVFGYFDEEFDWNRYFLREYVSTLKSDSFHIISERILLRLHLELSFLSDLNFKD